jgi:hypothetical protein
MDDLVLCKKQSQINDGQNTVKNQYGINYLIKQKDLNNGVNLNQNLDLSNNKNTSSVVKKSMKIIIKKEVSERSSIQSSPTKKSQIDLKILSPNLEVKAA